MAKTITIGPPLRTRSRQTLCALALSVLMCVEFYASSSSAQEPVPPEQASAADSERQASLALTTIGLTVRQTPGAGVLLEEVTPGSSGAMAGLQAGDFVLAVNGKAVKAPVGLVGLLQENRNKKVIKLRVWRNGTRWTAELKNVSSGDLHSLPLPPKGPSQVDDVAGTGGESARAMDAAERPQKSATEADDLRRDVQQLRQELRVLRQRAVDSGQVGYSAPATTGVPTTGLPAPHGNAASPGTDSTQGVTRYGDLGHYYPSPTSGNQQSSSPSPSNRYAPPYPYPGNYSPPFTTFPYDSTVPRNAHQNGTVPYYQYYDQYDASGTRPYYYLTPSGARFGVRIGPYWFDYW